MKILDIDLDFFLSEIAHFVDGDRLNEADGFIPWEESQVRRFLETNCGLNQNEPVRGCFFVKHHEVFKFWRKLIDESQLEVPFEVVHVDAHADLGLGDASYSYIIGELVHKPVEERSFPKEGGWDGLGEGNYLAFSLACRWIKRLTYIHHPDYEDDILQFYWKDFKSDSGYLQLPKINKDKLDVLILLNNSQLENYQPLSVEPAVPFEIVSGLEYKESSTFSYVFLTQSPSYTPSSADKLIPVIMDYIKNICLD